MLDFIDRLAAVDLLHIDDLGAENQTDWVLEQLYSIVNARYEAERAIVATTNLMPDELDERARRAHGLAPGGDLRRPAPAASAMTSGASSAPETPRACAGASG